MEPFVLLLKRLQMIRFFLKSSVFNVDLIKTQSIIRPLLLGGLDVFSQPRFTLVQGRQSLKKDRSLDQKSVTDFKT